MEWRDSRPRGLGKMMNTGWPGFDERDGTVLELACGEALGVDVGELLELERALERDGEADVPAEEEDRALVGHASARASRTGSAVSSTQLDLRRHLVELGERCAAISSGNLLPRSSAR